MKKALLLIVVCSVGCIPLTDDREPVSVCEVEYVDLASERVASRFVFRQGRLVETWNTQGPGRVTTSQFERDRTGRIVRRTWTRKDSGEPQYWFSWRRVNGPHPEATVIEKDIRYHYDDAGNHVSRVTRSVHATASDTDVSTYSHHYEYDELGRKTSKVTSLQRDGRTSSREKRYMYEGGRLRSMTTALSSIATETRFTYDELGRLASRTHISHRTRVKRFNYDDAGRLQSISSDVHTLRFEYDDAGRLATNTPHGIDYTYDEGGRLTMADYGGGEGYRVQYSPSCRSSFAHPAVTPHNDYLRYYEGPYERRLTLPTAERERFLYH